jgi:hypothetical protein
LAWLAVEARAEAASMSPEGSFPSRAISAQIGWLETSLASIAAEAVGNIDLLLRSGADEQSEHIYHQLKSF